jgi:hypothetical protein
MGALISKSDVLSEESARKNLEVARENLQREEQSLVTAMKKFSTPEEGNSNSDAALQLKKNAVEEAKKKVDLAEKTYKEATSSLQKSRAENYSKINTKSVSNPLKNAETSQPSFVKNAVGGPPQNSFARNTGPSPFSSNKNAVGGPQQNPNARIVGPSLLSSNKPKLGGRSRKIKLRLKSKMKRKRNKTLVRR